MDEKKTRVLWKGLVKKQKSFKTLLKTVETEEKMPADDTPQPKISKKKKSGKKNQKLKQPLSVEEEDYQANKKFEKI
jgi:hypothetical protein